MFYKNEKEWHVYLHVEECDGGWVVYRRNGLDNEAEPLDNGFGHMLFASKKDAEEYMDSCRMRLEQIDQYGYPVYIY